MSENPNEVPQPQVSTAKTEAQTVVLAEPLERLFAALLDGVCVMIAMIPFVLISNGLKWLSNQGLGFLIYSIVLGIVGFGVFIGINYKFLVGSGQTIGKKVFKMKVVDMQGRQTTLKGHLLKRYAFHLLLPLVPKIGQIAAFVNALFIFRQNRRCVHDLVAGTQVVKLG